MILAEKKIALTEKQSMCQGAISNIFRPANLEVDDHQQKQKYKTTCASQIGVHLLKLFLSDGKLCVCGLQQRGGLARSGRCLKKKKQTSIMRTWRSLYMCNQSHNHRAHAGMHACGRARTRTHAITHANKYTLCRHAELEHTAARPLALGLLALTATATFFFSSSHSCCVL